MNSGPQTNNAFKIYPEVLAQNQANERSVSFGIKNIFLNIADKALKCLASVTLIGGTIVPMIEQPNHVGLNLGATVSLYTAIGLFIISEAIHFFRK
jgi:hypothetical protein